MKEYTAENILDEVLENVAFKVNEESRVATIGRQHGSGFLTGQIAVALGEIAVDSPDMPAAEREDLLMNIMSYAGLVIIQERQRDLALMDKPAATSDRPDPYSGWNTAWGNSC